MNNENLSELKKVLERANSEDRANLQMIIGAGFGNSPELLCDHMHFLRSGMVGRGSGECSYKQLVTDVADHVHIDWPALLRERHWDDLPVSEIEAAVALTTIRNVLTNISGKDRHRIAEELGKEANDPYIVGELLTGGALVFTRVSGSQLYLLTATAVGALTGALGIVLPFAIYTGMNAGLNHALGPTSWASLGISEVLTLNQGNWSRLVLGIVYVSYIRQKLDTGA